MGGYHHKFRLSGIFPTSWYYKLKNMTNPSKPTHDDHQKYHPSTVSKQPHLSDHRKSYHFTREFNCSPSHHPPRKSSRRRRNTCSRHISSCRESLGIKPPDEADAGHAHTFDAMLSWSTSCSKCKAHQNDTVIHRDDDKLFPGECELHRLPPIITKKQDPRRISKRNSANQVPEENAHETHRRPPATPAVRRLFNSSTYSGLKLRTNSPRIVNRRVQHGGKRRGGVSEKGLAVVKSSNDPRKDFMESMVEMIVENDLRAAQDLEELLACYLSLNSDEYHDLIINVFKQIWYDFIIHLRLKP